MKGLRLHTRTVPLGEHAPASAAVASGPLLAQETDEDGVTYASEDPGIDYTEAPGYGRISFSCAYPDGGVWLEPGSREIPCHRHREQPRKRGALHLQQRIRSDSCLLVWEDEAGVLFSFGSPGPDVGPGYASGGRILRGSPHKDCARL